MVWQDWASGKGGRAAGGNGGGGRGAWKQTPPWKAEPSKEQKELAVLRKELATLKKERAAARMVHSPTGSMEDFGSPLPDEQPTEEALRARLASLQKMKAAAAGGEDRAWVLAQISGVEDQLRAQQPLRKRIDDAKAELAARQERLKANQLHAERALESLRTAKQRQEEARQQLEELEEEEQSTAGLPPQRPPLVSTEIGQMMAQLLAAAKSGNGMVTLQAADIAKIEESMATKSQGQAEQHDFGGISDDGYAQVETPGATPGASQQFDMEAVLQSELECIPQQPLQQQQPLFAREESGEEEHVPQMQRSASLGAGWPGLSSSSVVQPFRVARPAKPPERGAHKKQVEEDQARRRGASPPRRP